MKITLDLEKIEQSLPIVKDSLLRGLEGSAWSLDHDAPDNLDPLETEVLAALVHAVLAAANHEYVRFNGLAANEIAVRCEGCRGTTQTDRETYNPDEPFFCSERCRTT